MKGCTGSATRHALGIRSIGHIGGTVREQPLCSSHLHHPRCGGSSCPNRSLGYLITPNVSYTKASRTPRRLQQPLRKYDLVIDMTPRIRVVSCRHKLYCEALHGAKQRLEGMRASRFQPWRTKVWVTSRSAESKSRTVNRQRPRDDAYAVLKVASTKLIFTIIAYTLSLERVTCLPDIAQSIPLLQALLANISIS